MSFDDYARHIYQKYRLAVAIAIIKSKPIDIPTSKFLDDLKSKMADKMDDDDITVCSDDFLFDDDVMNDSETILKDFNPDNVNNGENLVKQKLHTLENLSQIIHYDSQTSTFHNFTNHSTSCSTSQNINNNLNFKEGTPTNNIQNNETKENTELNIVTSKTSANLLSSEDMNKTIDINDLMDVTYYDSQPTIPYTVYGFTENFTHYSESQNEIIIPSKFIYGTKNNENNGASKFKNNTTKADSTLIDDEQTDRMTNKDEVEFMHTMNVLSQNHDEDFDDNQRDNRFLDNNNTINAHLGDLNAQNSQIIDEMSNIEDNDISTDINHYNPTKVYKESINEKSELFSQNINRFTLETNSIQKVKNVSKLTIGNNESQNLNSEHNSIAHNEDYDESEDIISYKVLEEFNKVKTFLRRQNRRLSCDGYSTDSGYRSDSQRSINRSALQLSGNWLNQSGCCIFNYIIQCPLVVSSRDITEEIAQVLAQLIDRLHEEEKYPTFIENMFDTVDLLLRQLYEGDSSEDNQFLKKDENIQRILLLNKSVHIQNSTIEKISIILENFHEKITDNDSVYELTNIDEIENVAYIFHILENLLKKYLSKKEVLSQTSTQNSQDDQKNLNKSSITDIWRRKWNPSQKTFEGSREKKCVLKICSEILNKIVVDCVSSYSLVAYSALKCFNSMQS